MKKVVFKVKEGKLETWKAWCALLNTQYKKEVLETLKEEGVVYEAYSTFKLGEDYYVLGESQSENQKPTNLDRELNKKHKEMKKECFESATPLEVDCEFHL